MLQKLKNRNNNQEGFTIIEVLIVLAIAGLILLIVFLAVPALQRNARNTSRKTDAAGALGAMNEYANNNGGALPAAQAAGSGFAAPVWTVGAAGTAQSTSKFGYFTTGPAIVAAYAAPAATAADTLTIYEGTTCTNATTSAAGTGRQVAAVYALETAAGLTWQCTAE